MDERSHSQSILVAASPEALYAMVSDVTRMGEWSPVCRSCWWDEGAPVGDSTELTESCNFLDGGVAGYQERWGEDWPARFAERRHTMLEGIPATLAAIKAAAEAL